MANELQIRLTADIAQLQSAFKAVKKTVKEFQDEGENAFKGSNKGAERQIGLIEALNNRAKTLRKSLQEATNVQDIARYNQQLEETSKELTRLNALGRSVTANLGSTAGGFGQVARQGANANGVAIEFNRVIQDAPFGLIGIGNNLQQLAGNFQQVAKTAGGTGAAIKASLASIISPVNLGLLAVSALTAGFTAYQMGAFDGILATEDVGKAAEEAAQKLEDYRTGLDAVTRAQIEGASQAEKEVQTFGLLRAQAENANIPLKTRIEAVRDLQQQYPDYLGSLTQEQILTGDVGDAYQNLTKQIIATAKARAASDAIAENSLDLLTREQQEIERVAEIVRERDKLESIRRNQETATGQDLLALRNQEAIQAQKVIDLVNQQVESANERLLVQQENIRLEEEINNQINQGAKFTETQVKAVKSLNESFDETIARVQFINQLQSDSSKKFTELAKGLKVDGETPIVDVPIDINFIPEGINNELGLIQQLQAQIQSINALRDVATDPTRIQAYNEQLKVLQAQLGVLNGVQDGVKLKVEDLSQAFTGLGSVIGKAFNNPQFGTFIGQFAQFVTKIVAGAFAVSKANAVAGATQSSLFTGPAAAFTLPAFIASAVGLVASAFSGIGGGARGGGFSGGSASASSGAPPQIFTNSQIPRPPGSSAPTPTGNIDFGNAQGRLEARIDGNDIVFVYDRTKERQQGGG